MRWKFAAVPMAGFNSPGSSDYAAGYRDVETRCESLDNPAKTFHLLTVTEGGTVSLLKELTELECYQTLRRAMPRMTPGIAYAVTLGMIRKAECFQ